MAADRSVKVQLTAQVQGFIDGMEKSAKAAREVGTESEKLAAQKQAFQMLGASALLMGAAAAAGVTLAVAKWADFDQAMSNVQAATGESEAGMEALSNAALDAGARTVFSAEEAANAIEELAKAGVSTADILNGGLDGALDLAAAGGLGVADAAGIAATALKTFNLQGSDMAHVADLMAAGAGKAMGDVTDMSAAFNQSAMVANSMGLSIEETTGTLAAFASQGLLGSDAGTSFKSMLQSLTPTSGKAADTMKELGISAYDAQGNFIGMSAFAGNLRDSLKDLTVEQQQAAMKTIFGSDAVRAATVLYSEGEEGVRGWIDAVDDQGYAADQAATRLDNLKGDIEALGGALDTALIKTGSAGNEVLREMVQWITSAVDMYNELPAPLQSVALGVGVVSAGIALLGGGMALALPKFVEFWGHLNTLGVTTRSAGDALAGLGRFMTGPWSVALIAAAAVTLVLLGEKQKMVTNSKELAQTLDKETGAVTENSTAWAANKLEQEGILAMAERLGISSKDMTDAWLGNEDAMKRVNVQLEKWATNSDFRDKNADWKGWSGDLRSVQSALEGSNGMLAEAKDKHERLKSATEETADASGDGAEAIDGVAAAAETAAGSLDEMKAALNGVAGATLSMSEAKDAALSAINSLTEAVKAEGATLEGTDNASIALRDSMRDVETSHRDSAVAILENKGSMEEAMGAWQAGRQKVIEMRVAMGESQEQAVAWADQNLGSAAEVSSAMKGVSDAVNGIPPGKNINLTASGNALSMIKELNSWLASTPETKNISISGTGGISGLANGGVFSGGVKAFANSGFEPGIYPYTSGGIHKFAEEYGEAYISMDPARRPRSIGVWQEAGRRLGVGSGDSGPRVTNNISITAAPGMDEEGLANRVIKKLEGLL